MEDPKSSQPERGRDLAGIPGVVRRSLDRIPTRMRENSVTQSGWSMRVDLASGSGTIVLIELPDGSPIYRGDGAFLGWPQVQLAAVYQERIADSSERPFELLQLG